MHSKGIREENDYVNRNTSLQHQSVGEKVERGGYINEL